jgi:hypothetical protein
VVFDVSKCPDLKGWGLTALEDEGVVVQIPRRVEPHNFVILT